MRIFQVAALFILLFGFSYSVKSQADCRYGLKFIVQDETGKNIENVKLELTGLDSKTKLPSYVKLIRLDDAYVFTSWAGQTVNGNFQVRISADGFNVYEQRVNFPVCKIQTFEIRLKILKNAEKLIKMSENALTNAQKAILSGTIYDAVGAIVPEVKVTAINEKGEKFEAITNNEGVYSLNLPYNLYEARTSSASFKIAKFEIVVDLEYRGFEKFQIKDFKFIPAYSGKMFFDIALDSRNPEPCGYAGADCIESPAVKITKEKIQTKILQKPLENLPKKQNKSKRKNNK